MRHLRLYLHFLRFSWSRALEFRLDFFFRIVMDTLFYGVYLGFFMVLHRHTALLGGWTLPQTLIFVSGYFFVDALHMTVYTNNLWLLPQFINKGDLDYYLVRPVSPLFFLSLRDFAANSFVNLILASLILAWSLLNYTEPLPAQRVALFILLLINGCFLHYILYMMFLIPVFWLHSARGLHDLFFGTVNFAFRPDGIYKDWARRVLTSVLPFSLIASYPARVLFEGIRWQSVLHVASVTALAFCCMTLCWRRGLRAYASASS